MLNWIQIKRTTSSLLRSEMKGRLCTRSQVTCRPSLFGGGGYLSYPLTTYNSHLSGSLSTEILRKIWFQVESIVSQCKAVLSSAMSISSRASSRRGRGVKCLAEAS